MGLVSKNILSSLRNRLQRVVEARSELILSVIGMNGGPCCGGASVTLTVAFSLMAFFDHSVIVLCLDSRRVSLVCEKFLRGEDVVFSFSTNRSNTDEYPRTGSVSVVTRLPWNVVM